MTMKTMLTMTTMHHSSIPQYMSDCPLVFGAKNQNIPLKYVSIFCTDTKTGNWPFLMIERLPTGWKTNHDLLIFDAFARLQHCFLGCSMWMNSLWRQACFDYVTLVTMMTMATRMTMTTMMTISTVITIHVTCLKVSMVVFVWKLEVVHKKTGGCLISYNLQLACVKKLEVIWPDARIAQESNAAICALPKTTVWKSRNGC